MFRSFLEPRHSWQRFFSERPRVCKDHKTARFLAQHFGLFPSACRQFFELVWLGCTAYCGRTCACHGRIRESCPSQTSCNLPGPFIRRGHVGTQTPNSNKKRSTNGPRKRLLVADARTFGGVIVSVFLLNHPIVNETDAVTFTLLLFGQILGLIYRRPAIRFAPALSSVPELKAEEPLLNSQHT